MGERRCLTLILLILILSVTGCQSGGRDHMELVEESTAHPSVVAVFAHPDDETWISGTLAKMTDHGVKVFPVYATSGEAGNDRSGQGLSGSELASVREQEAIAATHILGLESPLFLRYPDGELNQFSQEIIKQLKSLIEREKPLAILTFAEGGITDNRDHKTLNQLVSAHLYQFSSYFGVSHSRAKSLTLSANKFSLGYKVAMPVEDAAVTIRVDVSQYKCMRVKAMASHRTQFTPTMIEAFADYVESVPLEEIISVNEGSHRVLERLLK